MKRLSSLGVMILVGIVSFIVFFYLMFPYTVLREVLANKLGEAAGVSIRAEKLSPSLPLGVRVDNISIDQPGRRSLSIKRIDVSINPFSLLLANVSAKVRVEDNSGGTFRGAATFPVFGLISQKNLVPSRIEVNSQNFSLSELFDFYLAEKARAPETHVMLAPILLSLDVQAKLNATVDLSINSSDYNKSHGLISLNLADAAINMRGGDLPIDNQVFSKAVLKANLQNGSLQFDKDSGFTSQDLGVNVAGSIMQKPELMKSTLDVEVDINVSDKIKEQFGFVISALTNANLQDKITVKISGALSPRPSVVVL